MQNKNLKYAGSPSFSHLFCYFLLLILMLGIFVFLKKLCHICLWKEQTNKMTCAQQRQISLGISPVWSESSPSAWRHLGSLATNWVHSEDSDQTGWMPRLIWVFAGHTDHFIGFVMRWLIYGERLESGCSCLLILSFPHLLWYRQASIIICRHFQTSSLKPLWVLFVWFVVLHPSNYGHVEMGSHIVPEQAS